MRSGSPIRRLNDYAKGQVSLAPLAAFRVLFGALMLAATLRFMLRGWVYDLYVAPEFHFSYYGFEWVKPLGETGMYLVFGLMALCATGIMLGAFYRIAATGFFLTFTYVELLDKANYLNHYYFVSLVAFLMIWLPAHRYFSVDTLRKPELRADRGPRWTVGIIRLQLGMVYFFAGLAKLNPDWLFEALPLKIWLPAHNDMPLIGGLLGQEWAAYAFSWAGALYDLSIPFLLLFQKTRPFAYMAVIGFHVMTYALFQIGMFPFIMMLSTLVFFPGEWHERNFDFLCRTWSGIRGKACAVKLKKEWRPGPIRQRLAVNLIAVFILLQALIPFRYLLYPGKLFWTEEGFRFGWRVMLIEKAGYATFYVKDAATGRESEVSNSDFLTLNQEKMMSTQPDMILQYAHYLRERYADLGYRDPEVRAEVYVTLQGKGSRPFIDPGVNLAAVEEGFAHKKWILPYEE